MANIYGLFEIHITIDTENYGFYRLWELSAREKIKIIFAVADKGKYPHQYMTGVWFSGDFASALEMMRGLESRMAAAGIIIMRSKIEAMASNEGVPANDCEFCGYMEANAGILVGRPYFEYHTKVILRGEQTCSELAAQCTSTDNVKCAVSINLCGSQKPLLTIRVYNHGREYADEQKDKIVAALATAGYTVSDKMQREFSVYDSNDAIDSGWLTD